MTTALILVDIQSDYFPGGKNELDGPIEASLCTRHQWAGLKTIVQLVSEPNRP